MRVLGVSGSPRKGQSTDRLVREVLHATGCKTEFVSLAHKRIFPCRACLACVEDNICKIQDDFQPLREKLLAAAALVIGAPNYFSAVNGLTHCFLERFSQFRHRSGRALAGKPVAIVSIGGLHPEIPGRMIERMLPYYQMRHIGTIAAQGAASCFTCGHGETCDTGAVQMLYGPGRTITASMIPDLDKQPEKLEEARALGRRIQAFLTGADLAPGP